MTADAPPVVAEAPAASSASFPVVPVVLAVILTLAFAGSAYWMFLRPSAATSEEIVAEEVDAETDGAEAADTSLEARSWNAAADTLPPLVRGSDTPVAADPPASVATIEEMVAKVMPAIVLIEATGGRGSGFFVRYDTLITNVHVVQNDGYVTVRKHDGSTVSARVEQRAPAFDIALLKVGQPSSSQAVISMGSSRSLRAGQEIIVIGSALGTLTNSVSRGVMSGLRSAGGGTLVQTDAASNPGNSGGPMLDRSGAAVGITTMGYKGAQGLNFGVAIDHAKDLLDGRQANLGTSGGLADIQAQSRGSESDRLLQQGQDEFRNAIREMATHSQKLDAAWQQFRQQCYTSPIAGHYEREWFAMMVPRALADNAGAGCTQFFRAFQADVRQFQGLMRRAINDARRAGVLPGTIRDVLRTNQLDFEWDR